MRTPPHHFHKGRRAAAPPPPPEKATQAILLTDEQIEWLWAAAVDARHFHLGNAEVPAQCIQKLATRRRRAR